MNCLLGRWTALLTSTQGINGYIVKAVRPFTPVSANHTTPPCTLADQGYSQKMLEDLKELSDDYIRETREMTSRGYQGSPMRASPGAGRQDAALQDPYVLETRFAPQPGYSSASSQSAYPSTAGGYPDSSRYPSQASGYPPGSGYQPGSAYPPGYGPGGGGSYPSPSGYPAASSYVTAGYPATAGRPGMPSDQNYTYADQAGEYSTQGYPFKQAGAYPGGPQTRDPRAAPGYPYVSSPQDVSMRGAPIDDRGYDPYPQGIPQSQSGRGAPYPPSRGTPVGYDPPPPQPRDGYMREPIREERRRR